VTDDDDDDNDDGEEEVKWQKGSKCPLIISLCTGWRCVVSFMLRPLNPRGKRRYSLLNGRLKKKKWGHTDGHYFNYGEREKIKCML
jgi:hypothetical protein